ncbi:unnamed protein product [Blumeria hordei]|uniref:Cyclin-like f-box protein n=1 Tax=Blumeria hordei TaxID=2867405 RepID=A0A383UNI6_BLUHO|nr:unnamed protein product [Blumeria hordei]
MSFTMLGSWSKLFSLVFLICIANPICARPKGGQDSNGGKGQTTSNAASTGASLGQATDGSVILDKTVQINGLPIRYRISAPADQFTAASGVPGAKADAGQAGGNGLNVLLHGDGGTSFFDFPNQAVQDGLMGVVVLAPNNKRFWGGGSGLQRTDGVEHAAAVNSLIQKQLAQDVAFDPSRVFFTGVSGGSLLLSGFFVPTFGASYKTGVVLNCGALTPQVNVVDSSTLVSKMKIHFQSTQDELASLQGELPRAVAAYESLATDAGLSADQIGALQTVDNSPNGGGHCGFDGKDFVSGVQLISSNYANIISDNPSGKVPGIKQSVLKSVVGNEKISFSSAT